MSGTHSIYSLIKQLAEKKVQIWLEDEALKFKAPKGAMDAQLKNDLLTHKQALISFLKEQTQNKVSIRARPDKNLFPVSHAQQRLWFIEQYEGAQKSADYNIPVVLSLRGDLDITALVYAINTLIARHEVLQTRFINDKGFPKQVKVANTHCDLPLIDLSHLDENEQQLLSEQAIEENIGTLFNLSQWPLFRLQLIKKSDGYIFLATLHHIIADGWSMDIFIKEIAQHYQYYKNQNYLQGAVQSSLPALPLQYADYAHWQLQWLGEHRTQDQLDFWKNYLKDSSVLELPLDSLRTTDNFGKVSGAHKKVFFSKELQADLNQFAQQQGLTLFMLLTAVFNILLARFSAQTDISLGIPVANRNRPEWESLIGFFVNTLVLRSDLSTDPLFSDFLKQVQENTLAIYSNQDLPFDRVVEALVSDRDTGFSPLFQVMFSLQNTPGQQKMQLAGLQIETLDFNIQNSRYDMTWNLVESPQGLEIDIEYRSDLFFERSIDLYLHYFENLLSQVVSESDRKISGYHLQNPQLTLQQVQAFNPPPLDYPHTEFLAGLFSQNAKDYPQHIAISHGDKKITYQVLEASVNLLVRNFQAQGITENDRVMIVLERSIEMIQAILAVLKLGACYVPLDPDYPAERKIFMQKDTAARHIVTVSAHKDSLSCFQNTAVQFIYLDTFSNSSHKSNKDSQDNTINNISFAKTSAGLPACIFYTSGSTGEPKGVLVPHKAIVRLVKNTNFAPYGPEQVVGHISNVCFDAASMEIWGALLNGGRLQILDKETITSAHDFEQALKGSGTSPSIDIMFLTAGLFKVLAFEKPTMFSEMKALIVGGDILDLTALRKVLNSGAAPEKILNGYGPTENCTFSTYHWIESVPEGVVSVPIGKPIHHSKAYIVDKQGRLLPPGICGELVVGGDGLALGYLNQAKLTEQKFVQGYIKVLPDERVYLTGDLAMFAPDGKILLSGRLDNQVKIRGFRIEPGEIENTLEKIPGIDKAVVLVKQHKADTEKVLVAYVVFSKAADSVPDVKKLQAQVKTLLPAYMQPVLYQQIGNLPLNSNGKVDRKALPEPDWKLLASEAYQAPANALEQKLVDIWQALLTLEKIGVHDNFFELGGHSLLATRLLSRIQEEFSLDLRVKQIFDHPTIEQLAQEIQKHKLFSEQSSAPELQALSRDENFYKKSWPLSKAQQRLWFIHQMDPDSSAYGMPMAITIHGKLDVLRLQKSLQLLIDRHESLRTRFIQEGDDVGQIIDQSFALSHKPFILPLRDIHDQQELVQTIKKNQQQPFDLEKGPLFTCTLLRNLAALSQPAYVLLMNMHHIISDGWSMQILQQELLSIYQQQSCAQLKPLLVQYVDFAQWQNQWLDTGRTEKLLAYWQDYLQGVNEVLYLPTDRPRPQQQSYSGALCYFELDKQIQQQALQFCRQQEVTSFVLGIAAYALLLSRYSQQNDFCIGVPVAGRSQQQLENIIGFFVNGLVVRSDIREHLSVREYLQKVKASALGAFAHQDLSADVLIDALNIKPSSAYQPLAQVAFSHQNYSDAVTRNKQNIIEGIQFEVLPGENHNAKYDLIVSLGDSGEQLDLACEFSTDLFDESSIKSLLEHYQFILAAMLADPEQRISQINWYSENDILVVLNADLNAEQAIYEHAFPLSANQQAIYLDALIHPATLQNSIANILELHQEIDLALWQQAFALLQQNHQVFRCDIKQVDLPGHHQAYQCIRQQAENAFSFHNVSDKNLDFKMLAEFLEPKAYCTYDIEKDPLYHYSLYKLASGHYAAMLRAHHIIFDGVSGKVFLEEIIRVYEGLLKQQVLHFDTDNFSEFVFEQNKNNDSEVCLEFWQKQLQACAGLSYHASVKTPDHQTRYQQKSLELSEQETLNIRAFCRQQGITPAIYFKGLYAALIYQYCRPESDFYFLEFAHGRSKKFEHSYGVYYQQTPFIVPLAFFENEPVGSNLFSALFLHSKNFQKLNRKWRDFSVQAQRRYLPSSNIGFMYNYTQFEAAISFMGKAEQSLFMSPRAEGQVQLFIREHKNKFELLMLYADDIFEDYDFLERLSHISEKLLHHQENNNISLLMAAEKTVVKSFNTCTEALPVFEPLLKKFSENSQKNPLNPALIWFESSDENADGYQNLDYQDLNSHANKLSKVLQQVFFKDVPANQCRVGIYLPLDHHYLIALLAIVNSGASYVPLQLDYPRERIEYIIENAQLNLVISESRLREQISSFVHNDIHVYFIDEKSPPDNSNHQNMDEEIKCAANDSLYTIYTSGSTGQPKGAEVSQGSALNLLQWYEKTLGLNQNDKSLIISAPGFDLTQKNFFALLRCGGTLILPGNSFTNKPVFDPDLLRKIIAEQQITHINCAPSAFYALLDSDVQTREKNWQQLSSLRWVILGGEAILISELRDWYQSAYCNARLMNSYGPTECTDVVSFYELQDADFSEDSNKTGSVLPLGKPVDHCEIYIVNQNQEYLPAGLTGEIAIGGVCVGKGYVGQAKLTEASFIEIPVLDEQKKQKVYLSGDLGRINSQGFLEYSGRKDFQIKIRGQRLELGEIEQALRKQTQVRDALVSVEKNHLQQDTLAAWVCSDNADHADKINEADLLDALRAQLPGYMLPGYIVILKKWPLNANGKIDRKALPKIDFTKSADNHSRPKVLARNEIEKKLSEIWCAVLGLDEVSVHDSFFELGGHSLLATKAVARLKESFEIDFPLRTLFDLHTIARIAEYIKTVQWAIESKKLQNKTDDSSRDEGFL